VNQFGSNGLLLSICDPSFAPALERFATQLNAVVAQPCVTGQVAKRPGTTADDCTVVSTTRDAAGQLVETAVPACADTGGVGPCWRLTAGVNGCAGQSVDVVPDPAAPTPAGQSASAECSLCAPGVSDPARGCP